MSISHSTAENLGRASWIRRMSDEGRILKAERGEDAVFDFSLGNPDIEPPEAFGAALARQAATRARGAPRLHAEPGLSRGPGRGRAARLARPGPRGSVSQRVHDGGRRGRPQRRAEDHPRPRRRGRRHPSLLRRVLLLRPELRGRLRPRRPTPDFYPDPEAIRAALSPRTACLLINSPNNPTGRVYGQERLAAIASVLEEHGKRTGRVPYLVADEPYREITYGGTKVPSPMLAYPETIVVSSWSKSLSLPGERIGYVAVSPRCAEPKPLMDGFAFATRVLGFVNAPALMQRAVAEVLDERADVASYERRGRILAGGLREAGYDFVEPEGAFYLFVRAPRAGRPLQGRPPGPRRRLRDAAQGARRHRRAGHRLRLPGLLQALFLRLGEDHHRRAAEVQGSAQGLETRRIESEPLSFWEASDRSRDKSRGLGRSVFPSPRGETWP